MGKKIMRAQLLARAAGATGAGVLALLAQASAHADPASIKNSYPMQFIMHVTSFPGNPLAEKFDYTVQVNTDIQTENVYYHSDQWFENNVEGALASYYSGIQPHADGTVDFRFSYFGKGGTAKSPNCSGGADDGNGITCGVNLKDYKAGNKYRLKISRSAKDADQQTWTGAVVDLATDQQTEIGSWSIPASAGSVKTGYTPGIVERYNSNRFIIQSCADVPHVDVSYTDILVNDQVKPSDLQVVKGTAGAANTVNVCNDPTLVPRSVGTVTVINAEEGQPSSAGGYRITNPE